MGEALSVRAAEPADFMLLAPPIADLPVFAPYRFSAAGLRTRWAEALAAAETHMQVALLHDQPAGLCWYATRGAFGQGAYLRFLAVVPEAQGQGVGLLLLQAFERACHTAPGGLFVLTSHHNSAGATFYRRQGYSQVGALPDFAVRGVTELVFWKR